MKLIILLTVLISINLSAKKEWVEKHYLGGGDITKVKCLDSNECYAFGSYGWIDRLYRSTDQGNTWDVFYEYDHLKANDSVYSFSNCDIVDSNNFYLGFVMITVIDKITDGGKNRERINFGKYTYPHEKEKFPIFDINMYDKDFGVIGISENLLITRDAWETYEVAHNDSFNTIEGYLLYLDSNNVIMQKKYPFSNQFVKYNIPNDEWSYYSVALEPPEGEEIERMYDACFVNDSVMFGCGGQEYGMGQFSNDIIFKSTDKGKHWEIIYENLVEKTFAISKIAFKDEKNGMAMGGWGKMMETSDGGETWKYHEMPERVQNTPVSRLTYAGRYPIISSGPRIYRYEETSSAELMEEAKIEVIKQKNALNFDMTKDSYNEYNIQLLDLTGRELHRETTKSRNHTVNLSDFITGMYLYRITSNGLILKTGKFIVE